MIGLDTNVLVRYLTLDDPIQSPRAVALVETHLTPEYPGYVSAVVLTELVWVLERSYRWDRNVVAAVVEQMLRVEHFLIEQAAEVYSATVTVREANIGFADALIVALNARAGCVHTVTFDRRALRVTGFAPV